MKASLRDTFYQMDPESDYIYHTLVGTVPGAPLADILFQLAMVRFHARLRSELAALDLQVKVLHPHTKAALSSSVPAWVDDIAVPIEAAHATELIPRVISAMNIVEELMRCTGVEVNFCRGKTEALVAWHGDQAKNMRQYWCIERCGLVDVPLRGRQSATLHLVDRYVHLGSLVCSHGGIIADIRHRAAIARSSFKAIHSRLLRNPCLSLAEKTRLIVQGPVASFLHGAGMWVMTYGRKGQAFKAVSGVISGFMRSSLRPLLGLSPRGLTDTEVCLLMRVLSPHLTLVVARLRHLVSVAEWLDDYALIVLLEESTWLRAVAQDLVELGGVVNLDFRAPTASCFLEWRRFLGELVERSGSFKAAIRAAVEVWSHGTEAMRRQVEGKAACLTKLFDAGGVLWRLRDKVVEGGRTFACSSCRAWFSSKAALGSHCSKVHGIKSARNDLGGLTSCQSCQVEYWSAGRLWDHLRKHPSCLAVHLESDCDFGSPSRVEVGAGVKPAVAVAGPRPFWATLNPARVQQKAFSYQGDSGLDHWRHAWEVYVREPPSNDCPRTLSNVIRRLLNDDNWRERAGLFMHTNDGFGQLCRVLYEGHGILRGHRVLTKGSMWAVYPEGLQEAAACALCF